MGGFLTKTMDNRFLNTQNVSEAGSVEDRAMLAKKRQTFDTVLSDSEFKENDEDKCHDTKKS